jgi:hypothetical protein
LINTNGRYVAEKGWDEYRQELVSIYRTERYKSLIICKEKTLQIKTDRYTIKIEMKGLKYVITELDNLLTHFIYHTNRTDCIIITYELCEIRNIGLMDDHLSYYYFYTPYTLDEFPITKD